MQVHWQETWRVPEQVSSRQLRQRSSCLEQEPRGSRLRGLVVDIYSCIQGGSCIPRRPKDQPPICTWFGFVLITLWLCATQSSHFALCIQRIATFDFHWLQSGVATPVPLLVSTKLPHKNGFVPLWRWHVGRLGLSPRRLAMMYEPRLGIELHSVCKLKVSNFEASRSRSDQWINDFDF